MKNSITHFPLIIYILVKLSLEVKLNKNDPITSSITLLKVNIGSLDVENSLHKQLEVITMKRDSEFSQEMINQSLYSHLLHITNYYCAPLAKSVKVIVSLVYYYHIIVITNSLYIYYNNSL